MNPPAPSALVAVSQLKHHRAWQWSWLKPEPPEIFLYGMAVSVLAWEWGLLTQLDAAVTRLEVTVAELARARGVAVEP